MKHRDDFIPVKYLQELADAAKRRPKDKPAYLTEDGKRLFGFFQGPNCPDDEVIVCAWDGGKL
jgi:hypothetical protein